MIILDTNVLSAVMRRELEPTILQWLNRQPADSVWTTTVTVFEIGFGIRILADGRRRRMLEDAFAATLQRDLDGRVLTLDRTAAEAAATIAAERHRIGRPIEVRDLLIAGIASARKASLATRNTRHFEHTGVALENPWRD